MCATPEACFTLKLHNKRIGLFDRKNGGVSHSAACVLGVVACQELSLIVTVLWDPKPKPFGYQRQAIKGRPLAAATKIGVPGTCKSSFRAMLGLRSSGRGSAA